MDLCFQVIKQKLTQKPDEEFIVDKSKNYLQLKFCFDEEWDNFTKYVILKDKEKKAFLFQYHDGLIVPSEIIKNRKFFITAYGVNDDVRITTNELIVNLHPSGYTTDFSPIDPDHSKDVIQELYELLGAKANTEDLSQVAFTGDYEDLTNKPAIEVETEIKKSFRILNDSIRTYGN